MGDVPSDPSAETSLAAELDGLAERISTYRASGDIDNDLLLTELEIAHEELRVAQEEVRTQQDELDRLVRSHTVVRTARERFAARLPVPVLFTDGQGVVVSANPATGVMLSVPHTRLVGKPLLSYVATGERSEIRRFLSRATLRGTEQSFHTVVTLLPRDGEPVHAELAATFRQEEGTGAEVMWALVSAQKHARA